jgi:hypothetical protein
LGPHLVWEALGVVADWHLFYHNPFKSNKTGNPKRACMIHSSASLPDLAAWVAMLLGLAWDPLLRSEILRAHFELGVESLMKCYWQRPVESLLQPLERHHPAISRLLLHLPVLLSLHPDQLDHNVVCNNLANERILLVAPPIANLQLFNLVKWSCLIECGGFTKTPKVIHKGLGLDLRCTIGTKLDSSLPSY